MRGELIMREAVAKVTLCNCWDRKSRLCRAGLGCVCLSDSRRIIKQEFPEVDWKPIGKGRAVRSDRSDE